MFRVVECIAEQHQHGLVLLAALVWIFGSMAMFLLLKRATDCVEARRRRWLLVTSIVAGLGVWATHFIAMLAYDGSMPISFGPGLTTLSVVFVILGFGISLQIMGSKPHSGRCLTAGIVAMLGIAAMHFTGMSAIIAPASIHYQWSPIITSCILVALAFSAAYYSFSKLQGAWQIVIPAAFAIFGVIALHFTAMSATILVPDPTLGLTNIDTNPNWLVGSIAAVTFTMILAVIISAIVDRMLTDLRGLTEATLEGLAIISHGRIIEANHQLAALLKVEPQDLIGADPNHWFEPTDGEPLHQPRTRPAEATVARLNSEFMIVEVNTHDIEYRGKQCQVLAVRDLTARKKAEKRIAHLAAHDALTDLPNRAHFTMVLDQLCKTDENFALLALDLDRFKAVNDVFGHAAGDAILCRVAALLRDNVSHCDLVSRIGGDEFLIIQRHVHGVDDAQQLAQRILNAFAVEMDITRDPMAVGVSIGVALYPDDAHHGEMLRHHADFALYRAKDGGRGTARFFDQDMDRLVRERRNLEHDMRHAVARGQLRLMYQPLVSTDAGDIIGYEALLRWDHPERGTVAPNQFIPIAEDIGAIIPIGEWVLREACNTARQWPDHISIAVNVSAVQFQMPNLPAIVASALQDSGLAPHRLELEVTESVMLRDRDSALSILHRLKMLGIRIVMDDFGTGYSSLSNLQAFPFDKIKIDRSFVSQLTHQDSARSILRAIVGLGRSLDLPVVAEGVETDAQRKIISDEGCPQAQGFYFGMPAAPVEIGYFSDHIHSEPDDIPLRAMR
ncbi:bifunctional diguanylate cyclase/phosphodiesterase [Sphingopyxis yananensis]|uniref:bifunctional diguanylate cyclase/phosphodiesterase n=1 Tax=Sphingopyxis yananensis TaxID=2886687 RepID=UPI001D11790D|nr:EAL domain-containing protein [Sphingopyxis yananensis]MCC2602140.1 EAL domain-containing protein [Sphingopyxis yananensis]